MNQKLKELINETIKDGCVLNNEPMSRHTTFKIGGCADVFITPGNIKEAEDLLRLLCAYKEPFVIIGNGSNILVSDSGIRGVVINISKGMDEIVVKDNIITAGAGALLSLVSKYAFNNSLTGLEFASGIPGSLGGALFMNAGAYGGEMKDVVKTVTLFDKQKSEIVSLSGDEMNFGYRHSIAKEKPYVILSAQLELKKGEETEIKAMMDDLNGRRREKQPLEYPSAGSTFKRPEGYFAGRLIEDAGLKGVSVGDAQVSVKHCGFVINKGNATSEDVTNLIELVREKVSDTFGVMLEPEVIMMGFENAGR